MGEADAEPDAVNLAALVERARNLGPGRVLLGICGAPGAGKSTLAGRLVTALGDEAVYVGMDGFHLAQVELERLGRTARKGAPDTFDAAGYVNLLHRLRTEPTVTVYAPEFRREIEEPIAGAVPVKPEHRIVVTEGNYLLLGTSPWHEVRTHLTETWFLSPAESVRRERLTARHRAFGRTLEEARERTLGSDEHNAVLINATRPAADLLLTAVLD
ncbi:nucleoside/nucleotide kinase family protein [Actinophytocola oryzae]|uniref:Pantothenate kinase n=1 Tax=Actinophytocola oryzae TaxID=502181 RepID=A0A4R7VDM6_9PSEU|nr:nucleoside/nucleotide kinase family protein [Actinophytocola oryzae]TDV47108.1 pantothenate kinase [Actinophytocola oryzae]